ncbi:hypothetical protein DFH06DRAFT_1137773 [Mycena polygramma]|nr:hypothetical protein DFH06DRAFT_1137773 [Mycena polygramma]
MNGNGALSTAALGGSVVEFERYLNCLAWRGHGHVSVVAEIQPNEGNTRCKVRGVRTGHVEYAPPSVIKRTKAVHRNEAHDSRKKGAERGVGVKRAVEYSEPEHGVCGCERCDSTGSKVRDLRTVTDAPRIPGGQGESGEKKPAQLTAKPISVTDTHQENEERAAKLKWSKCLWTKLWSDGRCLGDARASKRKGAPWQMHISGFSPAASRILLSQYQREGPNGA